MAQARIISIRLEEQMGGTGVQVEFGLKSIEKQIPTGQGLVRLSLILDDSGNLTDCELITEKM